MVEHTHLFVHGQVEGGIVLGTLAIADAAVFVHDASHFEDRSRLELVSGSLDFYDLDLTTCESNRVNI